MAGMIATLNYFNCLCSSGDVSFTADAVTCKSTSKGGSVGLINNLTGTIKSANNDF